jgi:hypothetical protein
MKRYKMLNFKVIIEKDGKFKKFGRTLVFRGTVVGNHCTGPWLLASTRVSSVFCSQLIFFSLNDSSNYPLFNSEDSFQTTTTYKVTICAWVKKIK